MSLVSSSVPLLPTSNGHSQRWERIIFKSGKIMTCIRYEWTYIKWTNIKALNSSINEEATLKENHSTRQVHLSLGTVCIASSFLQITFLSTEPQNNWKTKNGTSPMKSLTRKDLLWAMQSSPLKSLSDLLAHLKIFHDFPSQRLWLFTLVAILVFDSIF